MKKLIALLLALMMVFALCACGGSDEKSPEESKAPVETDDAGGEQLANPLEEVSAEQLKKVIGKSLEPPKGAEDVKTFTIAGEIGEIRFTYEGIEYCYRAQKTDAYQDISGVYLGTDAGFASAAALVPMASSATLVSVASSADLSVDGNVNIAVDEDGARGVATWFADGYSYSLSVEKGATAELLMNMYKLLTA